MYAKPWGWGCRPRSRSSARRRGARPLCGALSGEAGSRWCGVPAPWTEAPPAPSGSSSRPGAGSWWRWVRAASPGRRRAPGRKSSRRRRPDSWTGTRQDGSRTSAPGTRSSSRSWPAPPPRWPDRLSSATGPSPGSRRTRWRWPVSTTGGRRSLPRSGGRVWFCCSPRLSTRPGTTCPAAPPSFRSSTG